MLYQSTYPSPLGEIAIVCSEKAVKGVWFKNQKYYGAHYDFETINVEGNEVTYEVEKWLEAYFLGKRPTLENLILEPEVTVFRQKVLQVLEKVTYHELITYQEIANELENEEYQYKTSPRAVGGAVGHNPISILIPCHRVIGSNGSLMGYAGGIEKKIELLVLEGFSRDELETFYLRR